MMMMGVWTVEAARKFATAHHAARRKRHFFFIPLTAILVALLSILVGIPAGAVDDPLYDSFIELQRNVSAQPPALAEEMLTIEPVSVPDRGSGNLQYLRWLPYIEGRLLGRTRSGDLLRIVLTSKDREIGSFEVVLKGSVPESGDYFESFTLDPDASLGVGDTGDVTVIFRYCEASGEDEREIARHGVHVFRCAEYVGDGQYALKFAIRQDDLLGSSVAALEIPHPHAQARVNFLFWASLDDRTLDDFTARVMVNGTPLTTREDLFTLQRFVTQVEQIETLRVDDNTIENPYNFRRIRLISRIVWGPSRPDDEEVGLAEHPGSWVVSLIYRGKVVRNFHFTATADGMIASHEEEDARMPGALRFTPMTHFVETSFGDANMFDARFAPEAIKTSGFYGRAWTGAAVRSGMLDRLPPSKPGARPFPARGEL
jgi:hypothetical protein